MDHSGGGVCQADGSLGQQVCRLGRQYAIRSLFTHGMGVVFGKKAGSVPVQLDAKAFERSIPRTPGERVYGR